MLMLMLILILMMIPMLIPIPEVRADGLGALNFVLLYDVVWCGVHDYFSLHISLALALC